MMWRSWVVICWMVVWVMGVSAQTPEPAPSFETPRLTIEAGVLTVDDGINVTVPTLWDDKPISPVIYEHVFYPGEFPLIVGRVDDGTDNFFFGGLSYNDEPVGEMAVGWYVTYPQMYPDSRLFDIQVNEDEYISYLAIIGKDYPTPEWSGCCFPSEYLGKLIVYLWSEGTHTLTPPLEVSTTPDGETVYPILEAFGATYPVVVNGEERYDLPYDDFATIMTVDGERIAYGSRGQGLLAWETVEDGELTWVEPEEVPFTPAVQVDDEVLPLALHGGVAWNSGVAVTTEDGREVRVLKIRIPDDDVEENALYWVELSPLRVVRLAYWNDSLIEASLAFLPDASGILMSASANFGDGTGGTGVWRLIPDSEPALLVRGTEGGFADGGLIIAPRLTEVSSEGFTLVGVTSDGTPTHQRFNLDGTPVLTE